MTEHRVNYRWRRVAWGGTIACLAIALLALMVWAQRPRWRTYTFPPDPKTGMAVAIDYPDDWMHATVLEDHFSVLFRPVEPNSLLKWCREHLPGYRPAKELPTTIRFTFSPQNMFTIDEEEAIWRRAINGRFAAGGPFDRVQMARRKLPAGPVLDITSHLALTGSNGIRQRWRSHHFMIFIAAQNHDPPMTLGATGSMPEEGSAGIDARLQEAISRVRLVQVARK